MIDLVSSLIMRVECPQWVESGHWVRWKIGPPNSNLAGLVFANQWKQNELSVSPPPREIRFGKPILVEAKGFVSMLSLLHSSYLDQIDDQLFKTDALSGFG